MKCENRRWNKKGHCKKLLCDAIRKASDSSVDYEAYERLKQEGDHIGAEAKLRLSDQEIGYAEGIHQALVFLGFTDDGMEELSDLL